MQGKPYVYDRLLPSGLTVLIYRDQVGVTHTTCPMPTPDAKTLAMTLQGLLEIPKGGRPASRTLGGGSLDWVIVPRPPVS